MLTALPCLAVASGSDEAVRLVLVETRQLHDAVQGLRIALSAQRGTEIDEGALVALEIQLVVHHTAALRNKRALLAYHQFRLNWLHKAFWGAGCSLPLLLESGASALGVAPGGALGGGNAPGPGAGADPGSGLDAQGALRDKLAPAELDHIRAYADIVMDIKMEYVNTVDMSTSLVQAGPGAPGSVAALAKIGKATGSANGGGPAGGLYGSGGAAAPVELMVNVVSRVDAREVMTDAGVISLRKAERMRVRRAEIEPLLAKGWLALAD